MPRNRSKKSDTPGEKELQMLLERLDVMAEKIRVLPCLADFPVALESNVKADKPECVAPLGARPETAP
jgi:hypothetical protein